VSPLTALIKAPARQVGGSWTWVKGDLEPRFSESASRSGFQIGLEGSSAGFVCEGDVGFEAPWAGFCGVGDGAGIVFRKAGDEVVGDAGVVVVAGEAF